MTRPSYAAAAWYHKLLPGAPAELEPWLTEVVAPRLGGSHPIFGPLSDAAWLRWGYPHTDHHLRQFGA